MSEALDNKARAYANRYTNDPHRRHIELCYAFADGWRAHARMVAKRKKARRRIGA